MKTIVSSIALALAAIAALPASAATVYSEDFESGTAANFTGGTVTGSQGYTDYGYGNNLLRMADGGSTGSTLTLNLGSGATNATLNLSLAIIDSWDNGNYCCGPDQFSVTVDGHQKFATVFDNYLGQGANTDAGLTTQFYGKNVGFNGGFNDAGYGLTLALGDLGAGTHTIQFTASGPGWQGGDDESLGIDNLSITATAVPEPASTTLLLAGLLGVGFMARRRNQSN